MTNRILVGSRAFFAGLDGFKPKDHDYLELVENPTRFKYCKEMSLRGTCFFQYKKEPAAQMVARAVENGTAIQLGKFLVPEVAEAIGATVNDILPLEVLLPKLDSKHQYQAIIFNAYKKNGSFTLTDEQRQAAFASYLEARKTDEKAKSKDKEAEQLEAAAEETAKQE